MRGMHEHPRDRVPFVTREAEDFVTVLADEQE
jgi:hypothetical protein